MADRIPAVIKTSFHHLRVLAPILDVLLWPLTLSGALWFRIARVWGVKRLPLMRATFLSTGMYPIVSHYYDPLFDYRKRRDRRIPSQLLLDGPRQINTLKKLSYSNEWDQLPLDSRNDGSVHFHYRNGSFEILDAECYHGIIRSLKPKQILEVGSGFSTLLALEAIRKNKEENSDYHCLLTCIEPYERPFLDSLEVTLMRQKVEDIPFEHFQALQSGDILFIDSSHVIRPGGDVLHLILGVLPRLQRGVWVHVHDIFLPNDYPLQWLSREFRLWNEQYLLEAFLLAGEQYEIMAALNYLQVNYPEALREVMPNAARFPKASPGSFWIRKN
jgi:hypothetical protein